MRIAFWIPKATNTHSKYVIFIAFPLQEQSHEGATVLRSRPMPVLYRRSVHPITYFFTSFSQQYLFNFFLYLLFSIRTHLNVLGATHNPPRHTIWWKCWSLLLYLPSCVCYTAVLSPHYTNQHSTVQFLRNIATSKCPYNHMLQALNSKIPRPAVNYKHEIYRKTEEIRHPDLLVTWGGWRRRRSYLGHSYSTTAGDDSNRVVWSFRWKLVLKRTI